MLRLIRQRLRQAMPSSTDSTGAVLVTVVILMFVGVTIAATVAATVVFTITANDSNKRRTAAFVAAESGRDAARAAIEAATSETSGLNCSALALETPGDVPIGSGGVTYSYEIYASASSDPIDHEHGSTPSCPTELNTLVIIHAVGKAPGVADVTLDAVYDWEKETSTTAGGTLAYFGGTVAGQKSVYDGDLVVRAGNYECPNDAVITGDLWVTNGTASLSSNCHIMGSIYASGEVSSSSQGVIVDGDIYSEFDVSLSNNNGAQVGGEIHAGGSVVLGGSGGTTGVVVGDVYASGTISVSAKWDVPIEKRHEGEPAPVFTPALADVYDMTSWISLDRYSWDADEVIDTGCPENATGLLPGTGRLLIDYSNCTGNAVTITIDDVAVDRDVVFIVPKDKTMKVNLIGDITSSGPIASAPQLVFVHEDGVAVDSEGQPIPSCQSTGPDDLSTRVDIIPPQARIMLYTPCRLGGTVRVDFSGQFYVGSAFRLDDADKSAKAVNFNNGAQIHCEEMSWIPQFERVSCYIVEDDSSGSETTRYFLGDLRFQTEYIPAP